MYLVEQNTFQVTALYLPHTHSAATDLLPRAHQLGLQLTPFHSQAPCSPCSTSLMTELATHSPCPSKILSCPSQKRPHPRLRGRTGKLKDMVPTLETSFPGQLQAYTCFLQLQQFASVYPGGAQAQELEMSAFPFRISKAQQGRAGN